MQTAERTFERTLQGLLDQAKSDPQLVRNYYFQYAEPEVQQAMKEAFKLFYSLQPDMSHIADVLASFVPNAKRDSNVLFLASGEGHELVEARKVFPTGKFMAIDLDEGVGTVAAEIVADVEYFSLDLSRLKPKEVFKITGYKPDLVVCRHPHITKNTWWRNKFPEWAKALAKIESTMIITNFFIEEALEINMELEMNGFAPRRELYDKGHKVQSPNGQEWTYDAYVSILDFSKSK